MSAPPANTALERPTWACQLHRPPSNGTSWVVADHGYLTCETCLIKLREVITDIRRFYGRLDPTPGAMVDAEGRGTPGFGSKPGASLHVVAMRDDRSKSYEIAADGLVYEDWRSDPDGWSRPLPTGVEGPLEPPGRYTSARVVWYGADGRAHSEQARPPRSVPKALGSMAGMIAEDRDMSPPVGAVDQLCHWLDVAMEYVTRCDWVRDVDDELRSLRAQLRPVAGEGRKHKILTCPNTIDLGDHSRMCGANLYEPNRAGVIKCHTCGREWPRDKWHGDGPDYLSQLSVDSRPRQTA